MSDDFDDFELPGGEDLSNVPDSGDPPPGRYLFEIAKMEMKGRKNDPSVKFINIQFKILDTPDDTNEGYIGRSVFDIFNLGEAALWKLKELIKAVKGEASGSRVPNLTGDMVIADTFEDTYQGRTNLRTKSYKSSETWLGVNMDLTAGAPAGAPAGDPPGDTPSLPSGDTPAADAGTVEI